MNISRTSANRGGVLVMTLIICGLIGLMLTAYLSMLSTRQTLALRSQVWNNCMPMCEAGIEEALAHLNHRLTPMSNFAINGWAPIGTGFVKERTFNDGKYTVVIGTNYPPAITAEGRLAGPAGAVGISRRVRVQTKVNQRFPYMFLAKGKITCGGNGSLDSYNSTNALESLNGQYSPARATDHALVATVSRIPGDLSVGNVTIFGSVATGPGGTALVNPNGNVGSFLFNNTPAFDGQIEAGHSSDDVNLYVPDFHLPAIWGPWHVPTAGNIGGTYVINVGWVGGTNYTFLFDRSGDYQINALTLTSGEKMLIKSNVHVRLYVVGETYVGGSDAQIIIMPGASIEWYAGDTVTMGGSGLINNTGNPKNFSLIGLPTCKDITYAGSAQFIGTVYAPRAKVVITGSADGFGAIVANEISLQGGMSFHYDEALKGGDNPMKFWAAQWREL